MAIHLFDYQVDAVNRLQPGSILKGNVGSGKSITALAYFYTKICNGVIWDDQPPYMDETTTPCDLFIITTAKKRDSKEWEKECSKFSISPDPSCSVRGIKLTVDSWNNIHKYIGVKNCFFILDEQRLVGSGSWVSSFLKIVKSNKWILLTATPGDDWMDYVPVFIAHGFYRNRYEFIHKHVVYNPYVNFPKIQKFINEDVLIKMKRDITVEMDYQVKRTTNNITRKVQYDAFLEKETLKNRWNYFKDAPIENASQMCYLLRRISNENEFRVEELIGIIKEHRKVIVFYNFNYELELIKEGLAQNDIAFSEWNGHKHEEILNGEEWAYLVQYSAGAEGWECTTANTVVFFSQSYSYKMTVQAAGRINRLNTPFEVLWYYHLVTDSLLDKAISENIEKKKNFNETKFIEANNEIFGGY